MQFESRPINCLLEGKSNYPQQNITLSRVIITHYYTVYFLTEITRERNQPKNVIHIQSTGSDSVGPDVDLTKSSPKAVNINVFKELKQKMFKELNKCVLMSEYIRLVRAEERIRELEDKLIEIIHSKKMRVKRLKTS